MYYLIKSEIDRSGLLYDGPDLSRVIDEVGSQDPYKSFGYLGYRRLANSSDHLYSFLIENHKDQFNDILPAISCGTGIQIINYKLLNILKEYNLPSHTLFNAKVKDDKIESAYDYFMLRIDQSIADFIDYNKSIFYFGHKYMGYRPCVSTNRTLRNHFYGVVTGAVRELRTKRIVLDKEFDLDYFLFNSVSLSQSFLGHLVSKRLKERIEEEGVTGLTFEPCHELVKDSGDNSHIVTIGGENIKINQDPEIRNSNYRNLLDWVEDPLQFGNKADKVEIIDKKILHWPSGESVPCYLIAYSVNQDSFIGFSGPVAFTFINIDNALLSKEDLYVRYVGWYIVTHMINKDDKWSRATDPDLIPILDRLRQDSSYKDIFCTERISCELGVYYEFKARSNNKDIIIVGKNYSDFEILDGLSILPLYAKIGLDWNPFIDNV